VRVLRELADDRTEREAAERLRVAYASVRSAVQVLKCYTGCESVHDLRRWWRQNRESWAEWLLEQGGRELKRYVRYLITVREVGWPSVTKGVSSPASAWEPREYVGVVL
jgi:hypothetical protein